MPFWDTYYHLVWSTFKRQHLITAIVENTLFGLIQHKSQELGCPIHAINSMPDHVHIVVSIKPSLAIAKWVKDVKGYSSYQTNQLDVADVYFNWQSSYGCLTYGRKVVPEIVEYVKNQKQRHSNDDIYAYLERTDINEK